MTFDDALNIARGCTDYGGGYRGNDAEFAIYQHGISTVIAALAGARKHGMADTQVAALHSIGAAPQAPAPEAGQAWQPIETAPKDKNILLADAEWVGEGAWQEGWPDGPDDMGCDDGFVDLHYNYFSPPRSFGAEKYRRAGTQPTHWMPLPTPPAQAAMQAALDGQEQPTSGASGL